MRVALVVAAVAAVSCAGALAAAALPSERVRVVAAVRTYVANSGCCDVGRFAVQDVHISAADDEYAVVRLEGFDSAGQSIGPGTVALHRELGVWNVLALGSDELGCSILSAAVRADLGVGCNRPGPAG